MARLPLLAIATAVAAVALYLVGRPCVTVKINNIPIQEETLLSSRTPIAFPSSRASKASPIKTASVPG